jgi:hypothetical protein
MDRCRIDGRCRRLILRSSVQLDGASCADLVEFCFFPIRHDFKSGATAETAGFDLLACTFTYLRPRACERCATSALADLVLFHCSVAHGGGGHRLRAILQIMRLCSPNHRTALDTEISLRVILNIIGPSASDPRR